MAILNGVVWMEPINLTVETGTETLYGAIFKGAVSCLHPVLITATVGALGLIPMLLSNGVGSEIQRPQATVIVGGLVTSTLLTLFVLPALYTWFSKAKLEELRG